MLRQYCIVIVTRSTTLQRRASPYSFALFSTRVRTSLRTQCPRIYNEDFPRDPADLRVSIASGTFERERERERAHSNGSRHESASISAQSSFLRAKRNVIRRAVNQRDGTVYATTQTQARACMYLTARQSAWWTPGV